MNNQNVQDELHLEMNPDPEIKQDILVTEKKVNEQKVAEQKVDVTSVQDVSPQVDFPLEQVEGKRRVTHEIVRGYDPTHPYHFGDNQGMGFPQIFDYQVDCFKVEHVRTILFSRGGVFRTVGDWCWQFVSKISSGDQNFDLSDDLDSFVSDQKLFSNIDPLVSKIENANYSRLPMFGNSNWNAGEDLYTIPFPLLTNEYKMTFVHASGKQISSFVWLGRLISVSHLNTPVSSWNKFLQAFPIEHDNKSFIRKDVKSKDLVEVKHEKSEDLPEKVEVKREKSKDPIEKKQLAIAEHDACLREWEVCEQKRIKKWNRIIYSTVGTALVSTILWKVFRK